MQVAPLDEILLHPGQHALAEERAVGQHDRAAAAVAEQFDDHREEERRGLLGLERLGEVGLDAVLLDAAKGWVGDHHMHTVVVGDLAERPGERVAVQDPRGQVDAVQDQVRHAQQVGQAHLLDAVDALVEPGLVLAGADMPGADVLDRRGEEPAGAARRVENPLAEAGVGHLDGEGGHRAGRVVLAGVAGALQVLQELLVDIAEEVAGLEVVDRDHRLGAVQHLAELHAVLHVLEVVEEDLAEQRPPASQSVERCGRSVGHGDPRADLDLLERREERAVHELQQVVAGRALGVGGPVPPSQVGVAAVRAARVPRDIDERRDILVFEQFEFLLPLVPHLEEEDPRELADAVHIAPGAGILPHLVLQRLHRGGRGHRVVGLLKRGSQAA